MSDFIMAAIIAAVPPTLAVWVSHKKQAKEIEKVHVLVNSRLTTALEEIALLKTTLSKRDADRAQ